MVHAEAGEDRRLLLRFDAFGDDVAAKRADDSAPVLQERVRHGGVERRSPRVGRGAVVDQHRESLPAQPGRRVAGSRRRLHAARDRDQDAVGRRRPQRLHHPSEAINADVQNGGPRVRLAGEAGQRLPQPAKYVAVVTGCSTNGASAIP